LAASSKHPATPFVPTGQFKLDQEASASIVSAAIESVSGIALLRARLPLEAGKIKEILTA
jgi:hypothetical protein